jgi:hypothetical protein
MKNADVPETITRMLWNIEQNLAGEFTREPGGIA